ncbi:MAG: UvrD-helicase domain-containing protein [bacterium]
MAHLNNFSSELNSEQQKAVATLEGPMLILAGAGAGKTKTVTYRILNLIQHGITPSRILAITFTNKAAKEMRERVNKLLESDTSLNRPVSMQERPFVSTFHALGVHIIKEQSHLLGLPRYFTIYDRSDSKRAVKDAVEGAGLDPKQFEPGMLLNKISKEKGEGRTNVEFRAGASDHFSKTLADVWDRYETTLKKEKSLDFDDLLLKTAILLKNNVAVREYYSTVWHYIHVDEYQDTNKVQYDIVKYLAQAKRNICVVGDVDQNIYSWRGATIHNILNFEKDYSDAKVILLEENYRSTQTILSAANNVITKNKLRREKNLFTKNVVGEKVSLVTSYTEQDEARSVADKVRDLIEGRGNENDGKPVDPKEIAILYRANFQSRILEEAFLKKNIPYQILGTRFFDRKEVKDIISFIRAAINRESTSDLVRVINVPPRGIGKATIIKVVAGQIDTLSPAFRVKIKMFMELLDRIKLVSETETPSMLVKYIIRETGMELGFKKGGADELEKLENVRELASVAAMYDGIALEEGRENAFRDALESFLSNAALASDQDEIKDDANVVKLMTVHASKGLEFDYVFITGLEEDLFPHKRIGEENVSQAQEEEERRLFYVALTRARKRVFLNYAQLRTIYGNQKINSQSQFVGDIGHELIEEDVREIPSGIKAIFIDF